jgi:hypothetical protein
MGDVTWVMSQVLRGEGLAAARVSKQQKLTCWLVTVAWRLYCRSCWRANLPTLAAQGLPLQCAGSCRVQAGTHVFK